ncbi:MAG: tRNA (cytidine(34)-2'-O)-methyltransferase [Pseudobdellovibrionaceae bacterium]|nr:tRNA (cytidine(34)-2'-O)-methyltransferase [Pseudobdellovibrionaceae bacterium]
MDRLDVIFHVVLIEPEIPQNTGNIGRTCVGFNSYLHLVGPLGFSLADSYLKRAGLDYWPHLKWCYYENRGEWERTVKKDPGRRLFYFSAKATKPLFEVSFEQGDTFVFGKETAGLPDDMLQDNSDRCLLLPMVGPIRGYNLATSVAMVLLEAYRQAVYHDRRGSNPLEGYKRYTPSGP